MSTETGATMIDELDNPSLEQGEAFEIPSCLPLPAADPSAIALQIVEGSELEKADTTGSALGASCKTEDGTPAELPRRVSAVLVDGTSTNELSPLNSQLVGHFEHRLGVKAQGFESEIMEEEASSTKTSMTVAIVWQSCAGPDELTDVLTKFTNKIHRETPKLLIVFNQLEFTGASQPCSGSGQVAQIAEVESCLLGANENWSARYRNLFLIYKQGKPDQLEFFLDGLLKAMGIDVREQDVLIYECISTIVPSKLKQTVKMEGFFFRDGWCSSLLITGNDEAARRGVLRYSDLWKQKGWDRPFAELRDSSRVREELEKDECYVNDGDGRALIISNRNFTKTSKTRKGTDFDLVNLADLFIRLGFRVEWKRDLRASEMKQEVKKFCKSSHGSSCILAILTHGGLGHLEGIDGEHLLEKKLQKIFGNSEPLARKPRLLIIQACRDDCPLEGRSVGTEVTDPSATSRPNAPPPDDFGSRYVGPDFIRMDNSPSSAGLVVAHSTTPGMEAYRHEDIGSRFITALCMACHEYADKEDVLCLINRVNASMTKLGKKGKNSEVTVPLPTQISRWIVQTTKKFYLLKTPLRDTKTAPSSNEE